MMKFNYKKENAEKHIKYEIAESAKRNIGYYIWAENLGSWLRFQYRGFLKPGLQPLSRKAFNEVLLQQQFFPERDCYFLKIPFS